MSVDLPHEPLRVLILIVRSLKKLCCTSNQLLTNSPPPWRMTDDTREGLEGLYWRRCKASSTPRRTAPSLSLNSSSTSSSSYKSWNSLASSRSSSSLFSSASGVNGLVARSGECRSPFTNSAGYALVCACIRDKCSHMVSCSSPKATAS